MQLWFLEWVAQLWPGASWGRPCFQTLSRPPTVPRTWTRSLRSLPVLKFFFDLVWLKFNVRRRSRVSKIGTVRINGFFPPKIAYVSPSYTVCFVTQPCFDLCRLIFAMHDLCLVPKLLNQKFPILKKTDFPNVLWKTKFVMVSLVFRKQSPHLKNQSKPGFSLHLFTLLLTPLTAVQKTRLSTRVGSLRIQRKSLF